MGGRFVIHVIKDEDKGNAHASSSIGRAAVSKTAGWGFKSLLACHLEETNPGLRLS